jgi:hypothetical protein
MPDYSKGRIYRIVSPSHPEDVYYGSTIQTLGVRMCGHRKQYIKREGSCSSSAVLQYGDAIIILVEMFPCQSVEELRAREGWYILNNPCVNKKNPTPMTVERRREKEARWRSKHSQQATCECGGVFNVLETREHQKTLRHTAFIETGEVYIPRAERITCVCGGFHSGHDSSRNIHEATAKHQKYISTL